MKHFKLLIVLVFTATVSISAQTEDDCPTCPDENGSGVQTQTSQEEYDVIKLEDQMHEGEYVPREILIKFKDEVSPVLGKSSEGYAIIGIQSVDQLFAEYKVTKAKKLFENTEKLTQKETFTTFTGYTFERPSLHNIHKLEVEKEVRLYEAIESFKENENVEYAEPNYVYSIVEDNPVSPPLSESELKEWLKENKPMTNAPSQSPNQSINQSHTPIQPYSHTSMQSFNLSAEASAQADHAINQSNTSGKTKPNSLQTVTPNDPLYSEQWGIPATQIDAVWDSTKGDTSQVIAILDTGVDMLHPDLTNKIWENPGEIPDNGVDDDGNGFVDDVKGWDYINQDNDPKDDNSHGTHVAGIAAAESNNGIGIAGVNWKAKIMPIKVFQSSGRGDAATITEGIIYASEKGADVINMSFSSTSRSIVMEEALANAYANSVLVAAAGNDGRCIGPGPFCARYYPAAISYVLGIEATNQSGNNPLFSNYDQDGPVFSRYDELNNYELRAPGVNIISAIPNGNYRVYNGTSMSTPLVSGAVSLYTTVYPGQSQELMWGNLINTISGHIQLENAINVEAKPNLQFVSSEVVDTIDGDGDRRVDAGETIELWFEVRNTWGQSDSVWCGIEFGEFEDTTTANIVKEKAFIGSISPYARRTNEMNPLKIKIASNIAHNSDIVFNSSLWYKGSADTNKQNIVLNAERGVELSGVQTEDDTLFSEYLYLVNESYRIGSGATLFIEPGTEIQIYPGKDIEVRGRVIANGTPDSLIWIHPKENGTAMGFEFNYGSGEPPSKFTYCKFTDFGGRPINLGAQSYAHYNRSVEHCIFENCNYVKGVGTFRHNIIRHTNRGDRIMDYVSGPIEYNNIYNIHGWGGGWYMPTSGMNNNNFMDISITVGAVTGNWENFGNSFINLKNGSIYLRSSPEDVFEVKNQYWGTTNQEKIDEIIYDFWDNNSLPLVNTEPILIKPSSSNHGVVWKVEVNGVDPQDEHLDPIGPGEHRFDVYFNRPMDTDYTPSLGFGVRKPYNQHAVTDSSFWSEDSNIWTAYKTIKLHTGDGINRIRVADARDPEGFEIPTEDQRFEFVIDAAGLSSTNFNAIAGLGKIDLDWKPPQDVPDLLGYNLYRFTNVTDTTYSDTTMINEEMITDTTYTDYDVEPGDNYYYQYTVVKTDFSESDKSQVVGTKALTSSPGDANGDLQVNVLDITSMVGYLLNDDPEPFIYEAADIDSNQTINVLDIVGTVNIIMGVGNNKVASGKTQTADIVIDERNVRVKNGEEISGLQFKIVGKGIKDAEITGGNLLNNMEFSYRYDKDTLYAIIYNYKNKAFNKKEGNVLRLNKGKILKIDEITASNPKGEEIALNAENEGELVPDKYVLYHNYPNPFNPKTTIKYGIPKDENVKIVIYNILGERIKVFNLAERKAGFHEITWKSRNNHNIPVASGVYIYQIKAGDFVDQKKMILLK